MINKHLISFVVPCICVTSEYGYQYHFTYHFCYRLQLYYSRTLKRNFFCELYLSDVISNSSETLPLQLCEKISVSYQICDYA